MLIGTAVPRSLTEAAKGSSAGQAGEPLLASPHQAFATVQLMMMALDSDDIDRREEELLAELKRLLTSHGYDLAVLLVTNPLGEGRERILLKGETWIVEKAFDVKVEGDTCVVPRVLSRKKDFIPAIGQALSLS